MRESAWRQVAPEDTIAVQVADGTIRPFDVHSAVQYATLIVQIESCAVIGTVL